MLKRVVKCKRESHTTREYIDDGYKRFSNLLKEKTFSHTVVLNHVPLYYLRQWIKTFIKQLKQIMGT